MSLTPSPCSMDVLGDLAVRPEGAGHDERDVVPPHDVARPVADAGLEPRVGDRGEAPQRPEVVGGLAGVADPELDVVDALEGQEVLGLVVGVLVDVGAGLVGRSPGERVGHPWLSVRLRGGERGRRLGGGPATERRPGTRPGWSGHPCYAAACQTGRDGPISPTGSATPAPTCSTCADRSSQGEPWPLSAAYGTEPEADWGPREVLAHVNEMLPYWTAQLDGRPRRRPGTPAPFGRIATDPDRLAPDRRRTASRPRAGCSTRSTPGSSPPEGSRPGCPPADLERRGLHPTRGELTIGASIDRFLVTHLEEHVAQLREILARRGARPPDQAARSRCASRRNGAGGAPDASNRDFRARGPWY